MEMKYNHFQYSPFISRYKILLYWYLLYIYIYIYIYIIYVLGQRINKNDGNHESGSGTYCRSGYIYSSLAGFLSTRETKDGKVKHNVCIQRS